MNVVKPKIVVIGSLNIDFTVTAPRIPVPGETLLGDSFFIVPGGKGNNQAIAASRLGAEVEMVGCIGKDQFGKQLIDELRKNQVGTKHIEELEDAASGVALITVSKNAENSIVVASGANHLLSPIHIRQVESVIKEANVLLLQLEIPLETVIESIKIAKKHGVITVLNPAPGMNLPRELLMDVDYITPNETEMKILLSYPVDYLLSDDELTNKLQALDISNVVMTKGEHGVYLWNENQIIHFPSFKVNAIDTTAAGDAFNGALAVALGEGKSIAEAIQFAQKVASIAVTKLGSSASLPLRNEVEEIKDLNVEI